MSGRGRGDGDPVHDQNNFFLALALSIFVLMAWEYFIGLPLLERPAGHRFRLNIAIEAGTGIRPHAPAIGPLATPGSDALEAQQISRQDALAKPQRIIIDTPRLSGSIALTSGRIDDLSLVQYRETTDPTSKAVALLSPSGGPKSFYAEFGWVNASGTNLNMPSAETIWRQEGSGSLQVGRPVKIIWQNGQGLEFRRTISVDNKYLFTIKDEVANRGKSSVALAPYASISRQSLLPTPGSYLLHEGAIGVLGDRGLQQLAYKALDDQKRTTFNVSNAWLGFTDKYWAAILLPAASSRVQAEFSASAIGARKTYQADYALEAETIGPGESGRTEARLFAGAKEVAVLDAYGKALDLNQFDLLIDWGWFSVITKPMFMLIDAIFRLVGNFGVAIMTVTVVLKAAFFPLASRSYASMAKMKALQPQFQIIRENFANDKLKQQQETMALYRRENVNPLASFLPTLIQIPIFFALYKVLFITIEMRHAPFFGWIKDLSGPDPANLFNLFGLIPYDPLSLPLIGGVLLLGAWPLFMGVTQWVQMKLAAASSDPTQAAILNWAPVVFTFMLAKFPAGLVIYWTWNNALSIIQQSVLMRRHGVRIELWDNLRAMFRRR